MICNQYFKNDVHSWSVSTHYSTWQATVVQMSLLSHRKLNIHCTCPISLTLYIKKLQMLQTVFKGLPQNEASGPTISGTNITLISYKFAQPPHCYWWWEIQIYSKKAMSHYQSLLFTNECTSDCLKNSIKIYIKIAPTLKEEQTNEMHKLIFH